MSWNKRTPAADQQPYGAPQPVPMQPNMYSNYQGAAGAGPHQQYWQLPPATAPNQPPTAQPPAAQPAPQPQYNQQYTQAYQQQQGFGNANQFFPPPSQQYNQNFTNQSYNNTQPGYQQNFYQNPQPTQQPNYAQNNKAGADGWEDNWDWGWDDASKKGHKPTNPNIAPTTVVQQQHQPQQMLNNANVIDDSFATTDSWNWSMENKKDSSVPQPTHPVRESKEPVPQHAGNIVENNSINNAISQRSASNHSAQHTEEVRTLNDKEVVKERLPNLALGKRFHLETLTPQWSIESQMSQESSDGPNTHSEGNCRSENQSRNSSKGSPCPNIDNSNFNYSQSGFEEMYPQNSEWSVHSTDEPTVNSVLSSSSQQGSHDELSTSMQDMSIASHEAHISGNMIINPEQGLRNMHDSNQLGTIHPSPSMSPANIVSLPVGGAPSSNMPPPPPVTSASLLPAPLGPPPAMSSTNFPVSSSGQNPFKQSGPFSHKANTKILAPSTSPMPSFSPPMNSSNLPTPSKVVHNQGPLGFGANLETTPDNSERPDQPQVPFRPMPVSQQMPDNMEVAPQNDRNEYLQTAHLSSGDYEENTNFSGSAPPPGLRRMVVGQQESEYQNLNISADEPPPGLSRMVPGQQNESDSGYNQPNDNYMDRHVDGQLTDGGARPYRQADGQQTPENYNQPPANRGNDRRPVGLDRMVPGESSNIEYAQYQNSNYVGSNVERVVTGVDHDYPVTRDGGPSDVREQNMDGSDFSDQTAINTPRNIMSSREVTELPDFGGAPDAEQREVIMEGENLQDLSNISSTELTFSREQIVDGADLTLDGEPDRKTDASDSLEQPASSSRRHSFSRINTSGDDSDRDRAFKSSPRRDRDKRKSSREHERDKEGRYYEREPERRSVREDRRPDRERRDRDKKRERRDREESPGYKPRRSTRAPRYETDDTDYYSDREKERRRYREGSYTSKPPRPDDRDKRHDRERNRRYNTIERDRGYDEERDGRRDRHKSSRHEARYRNIDPTRKYGNLHLEREAEHRKVVTFSGDTNISRKNSEGGETPPRGGSGGGGGGSRGGDARTEDELNESRHRASSHRRARHNRHDPYYDSYDVGAGAAVYGRDPYLAQRQYQYYEQLRRTDPAAYLLLYKQLTQARPQQHSAYYTAGYGIAGYESRAEERGSGHSGRSSATNLKTDTELNTDASLNLQLEESTVRSERMTPFKYSTAHIKASISSRHLVVVRASYPVDGPPATVRVIDLAHVLRATPLARDLRAAVGPLRAGITHKKSVLEYVWSRARGPPPAPDPPAPGPPAPGAPAPGAPEDRAGYALLWEFLAALLTQNGVVVGTDLAELLMRNQKEFPYSAPPARTASRNVSRRESSTSREDEGRSSSPDQTNSVTDLTPASESAMDEQAALDKLRECLTYGDRHEALECAMSSGLWGHALHLSSFSERRVRSAVTSRFLASLPRADPLLTGYCALAAAQPPAASCVSEAQWGDWRGHAAMLLANTTAKPDRALIQMGDSLMSRGLTYSAQFCYVTGGEPFSRHPLAPGSPSPSPAAPGSPAPRLALLASPARPATLHQLATNTAILATEIYEYAMSLHQPDFVVPELQVYKLLMACRLTDVGECERALGYVETCSATVARTPHLYDAHFTRTLTALHNRLVSHDSALQESQAAQAEGDSGQPSPGHAWGTLHHSASTHSTPQHVTSQHTLEQQQQQQQQFAQQTWEQNQQYQQPIPTIPTYPEPAEDNPDYSHYYQHTQPPPQPHPDPPHSLPTPAQASTQAQEQLTDQFAHYNQWGRTDEQTQAYGDPYWQHDSSYGYGEYVASESTPQITLPGSARPSQPRSGYPDYDDDRPPSTDQADRETDTANSSQKSSKPKEEQSKESRGKASGGGGWLGGILTKLSLRPPNQMILPDDKNPSIVWDAEHKRWRNLDGDDDVTAQPPPPPPPPTTRPHTVSPGGPPAAPGAPLLAAPGAPPPAAPGAPPPAAPPLAAPDAPNSAAPVSNIFKMQKGRHIKKSYVDVLNPGGGSRAPAPPAPAPAPPPPPAHAQYFTPAITEHDQSTYNPPHTTATNDHYNSGI